MRVLYATAIPAGGQHERTGNGPRLAVAVEGYLRRHPGPGWRLLALIGALAPIYPGLWSDAIGAVVAVILLLLAKSREEKVDPV